MLLGLMHLPLPRVPQPPFRGCFLPKPPQSQSHSNGAGRQRGREGQLRLAEASARRLQLLPLHYGVGGTRSPLDPLLRGSEGPATSLLPGVEALSALTKLPVFMEGQEGAGGTELVDAAAWSPPGPALTSKLHRTSRGGTEEGS